MKTIFLTSHTGFYTKVVKNGEEVKIATPSDNSNNFIDRLKEAVSTIKNFAFVASDPDGFDKTHLNASLIVESLNLDGFGVESLAVIDHAFEGDIERTILEADVVFWQVETCLHRTNISRKSTSNLSLKNTMAL